MFEFLFICSLKYIVLFLILSLNSRNSYVVCASKFSV